jgi:hypothetical protein
MPTPINLNIATAQRTGVFETSVVAYPGGYSFWSGTLIGLGSGVGSDYENPANGLDIDIYNELTPGSGNYVIFDGFHWQGGPDNFKGQTDPPPAFSFPLNNLPVGNIKVRFTFTGTFTVGLSSTLS